MTEAIEVRELTMIDPEAIDAFELSDLIDLWQDVKNHDDWVASLKKASGANVETIRTAITKKLREAGTRSHTDDATGINCRIDTRSEWKVTDPKGVTEFFRRTERFDLLTVDTKAAIEYRKADDSYPVPGIELVESPPRLVMTPPKNGGK